MEGTEKYKGNIEGEREEGGEGREENKEGKEEGRRKEEGRKSKYTWHIGNT